MLCLGQRAGSAARATSRSTRRTAIPLATPWGISRCSPPLLITRAGSSSPTATFRTSSAGYQQPGSRKMRTVSTMCSPVAESSGFCTKYCGWHSSSTIGGTDIRFAFVGNPNRCPSACEMQTVTPNGDGGADGMASIMVHEVSETVTDPNLNAWYDSSGNESADKCALEVRAGHGYARTRRLQPDLRHQQLADPDAMGEQPRRRLRQSIGRQVL